MTNRALLCINLSSGSTAQTEVLGSLLKALLSLPYELTIFRSTAPGDIRKKLSTESENYHLILIAGGDGTLHEAINGMMEVEAGKRRPLAIIPTGTTCDYARSLAIPVSPLEAAQAIERSTAQRIDLGKMEDRYFSYVASFGAFSDIAYTTPQARKNLMGHSAYVLEGIKSLSKLSSYRAHIQVDDEEYEGNFIFGAVTNALSVGGIIRFEEEEVSLSDGKFEMILVRDPLFPILRTASMAKILWRSQGDQDILFLRGKNFHIQFEENVPFTLDGEFGGSYREARITVVQNPLQIMSPKLIVPKNL